MSTLTGSPTRPADESTFDFGHWTLSSRQIMASATVVAFGVALYTRDGPGDRLLAGLLAVETSLLVLPWRVPRTNRSTAGYWLESCTALVAPVAALVIGIVDRLAWTDAPARWWWYAVAAATGVSLMFLGGTRPGRIRSGEIAFLLGPARRSHARARAFAAAVAPAGEEALFRGPIVGTASAVPLGLLAAAAFVGRHYVQPGRNGRGSTRSALVEVVAAGALLALTMASGSIFPALVAHLVNNVPGVIVELQREVEADV